MPQCTPCKKLDGHSLATACSMFCCTLLYVHSSIAIILMGKRELIALLNLSSWCLVMVERLFLAVPRGCLQFVIVVFPYHTQLLFLRYSQSILGSLKFPSSQTVEFVWLTRVKDLISSSKLAWSDSCGL